MLLWRGAHATTLGFMAAVGRLKFGKRIESNKHRRLLMLVGAFALCGYPLLFVIWLGFLAVQSMRGRVATGDGFLVVLSRRTDNPGPKRRFVWAAGVGALILGAVELGALFFAAGHLLSRPVLVGSILVLLVGPVLFSLIVRNRRDDVSALVGALVVHGFVPLGSGFRGNADEVAAEWLAEQGGMVGWIADEGLRGFYEAVLAPWKVEGVVVNRAAAGFWAVLLPARYAFVKPVSSHDQSIG